MFYQSIDTLPELPDISVRQLIFLRIYQALKSCKGNRTQAAIVCGISLRMLRNHIKKLKDFGYNI